MSGGCVRWAWHVGVSGGHGGFWPAIGAIKYNFSFTWELEFPAQNIAKSGLFSQLQKVDSVCDSISKLIFLLTEILIFNPINKSLQCFYFGINISYLTDRKTY